MALRKIAADSRAPQPWFGFGDFVPVTLAQAEHSFPGAACARQRAAARRAAAAALCAAGAGGGARAARRQSRRRTARRRLHRAGGACRRSLKNYRILHFATHALLPAELRCQSQPAIVTSAPAGATDAAGALLTAVATWSASTSTPTW